MRRPPLLKDATHFTAARGAFVAWRYTKCDKCGQPVPAPNRVQFAGPTYDELISMGLEYVKKEDTNELSWCSALDCAVCDSCYIWEEED